MQVWASQVSFEDFSMFVDRYVRNFLIIEGQSSKKLQAVWSHEMARALEIVNSRNERMLIVSHLFKDTDVNWFITIPREN
jgi:hypothetical protein